MSILLYVLVLLSGISNAVEPGQNAALSKGLNQPWLAAIITLMLNALIFLAIGLFRHEIGIPSVEKMSSVPWWAWFGGATSSLIIASQLFVSEKIGAGRFVGIVVSSGIITSIVLDHFALVGFERHSAGLGRILGALLMVAGITLVSIF